MTAAEDYAAQYDEGTAAAASEAPTPVASVAHISQRVVWYADASMVPSQGQWLPSSGRSTLRSR
ncbi:MAG: hypothetical protein JWP30_1867 [Homoserinimonas sp.]|nr:hypothetical protein [Homoserinimonas sp.]